MLAEIESLFLNPNQDMVTIYQIFNAIEATLSPAKLVAIDGVKDMAINALIGKLQTYLSTYVAPVAK